MAEFDDRGVVIEEVANPELSTPVMLEGLPGVGYVGKLAVEHLLEEAEDSLVRRIHSEHLPPRVTIDESGVATLACIEVHHVSIDGVDLLLVAGDQQSQTPVGYYRLTEAILDVAEAFGVQELYALGGVPTGQFTDDYHVLGAVSSESMVDDLEAIGVEFRANEPAGGIVGVSGLLLGLGGRRGLGVSCLMGETSGYLVDPKSAKEVLRVLENAIGLSVDFTELETRAEEMEAVVRRIQELHETQYETQPGDENLRYID